ncbi:hypothetical protein L6452_34682 [Arctium lappa]|uniref:Uncharacterized protein n=1 Tax=Arctium lappa TaxID=4217 RepID=A0ACB8YK33_ARCLA|nr:hypothetical protein L6452_34682 [Arctium lappa]
MGHDGLSFYCISITCMLCNIPRRLSEVLVIVHPSLRWPIPLNLRLTGTAYTQRLFPNRTLLNLPLRTGGSENRRISACILLSGNLILRNV